MAVDRVTRLLFTINLFGSLPHRKLFSPHLSDVTCDKPPSRCCHMTWREVTDADAESLLAVIPMEYFCDAMVNKFSSINMESTTTKWVLKFIGELWLIFYAKDTWDVWRKFFDAHNAGNNVNPEIKTKYIAQKNDEVPPILREFFCNLQGMMEIELHWCVVQLQGLTVGRKLLYLKIFLKRPKHKPGTYYIKE